MKYAVSIAGRTFEVDVRDGDVVVDGRIVPVTVDRIPHTPLRQAVIAGQAFHYAAWRRPGGWTILRGGDSWTVEIMEERAGLLREGSGRHSAQGVTTVRAPMPGLVLRLEVAVGTSVTPATGLVVLEAMKMENEIRAGRTGVVSAIHVAAGQPVEKGAALVEVTDSGC